MERGVNRTGNLDSFHAGQIRMSSPTTCTVCHRIRLINNDLAGDRAAFNAYTETFGALAENCEDDAVTFGIIERTMEVFE